MIRIRNLSLLRTGFRLDVPSLDLPPRGFFLLTGENGSGKSTLLSVLAGTTPWRQGEVFLEERPLSSLGRLECAARISYLPQSSTPLPAFLGQTFAEQGLYAGGVSRIEALAAALQAEALLQKKCDQCSGGEAQLLRFMRACAAHRNLILLDEPESWLSIRRKTLLNNVLDDFSRHSLVLAAAHDERLFPGARVLPIVEEGEGLFRLPPSP